MQLQRQHFLLSYLKTLSVGPAMLRTRNLLHGSSMLIHWFLEIGQSKEMTSGYESKKTHTEN